MLKSGMFTTKQSSGRVCLVERAMLRGREFSQNTALCLHCNVCLCEEVPGSALMHSMCLRKVNDVHLALECKPPIYPISNSLSTKTFKDKNHPVDVIQNSGRSLGYDWMDLI